MISDLLLYWMTQIGEGSWAGFRKAVSELNPESVDRSGLARRLRIAMSDLGDVDFFIGGSQRWRVLPPVLAGLAADDSAAVLCGARTPGLILGIKSASEMFGCEFSATELADGRSRIAIQGTASDIQRAADQIPIVFLSRASSQLLNTVDPVANQLDRAARGERPINWDEESFDLTSLAWVKGLLTNAACSFTPRYGSPKFLLHRRRHKFAQLSKREAVYASAMIQGVNLLGYEVEANVLSVPLAAPLPERLARIACLCSGNQPRIDAGHLMYSDVPFDVASAIFVAAGQTAQVIPELVKL